MSLDTQLAELIHEARGAEAPPAHVRKQVREKLMQQLQSGARDPAFEQAVVSPPPRRLPRLVTWGAPVVALGTAALLALRLAPQTADPLVRAPQPPAVSAPSATPPAVAPPVVAAAPAQAVSAAAGPAPAPAAARAVTPPARAVAPSARVEARPARAQQAARPAPAPPAAASPDLLAESRALARVQQALRDGQAAQALRLLAEQEQEFARGALQEERAAARAMALCSSGQRTAGQSAVMAFASRYPESVLRARVQSSCATREEQP